MKTSIRYGRTPMAGREFRAQIAELIDQQGARRLCDVGGGANPLLDSERITSAGLDYTLLDISADELAKAPDGYHKLHADITAADFDGGQRFDLVFSRMLAEHVRDGEKFHRNVFSALAPGGYAVHLFPTLFTLPFVANRLFPERLAGRLLDLFDPRDRYQHDKFPAYYHWCRGPTERQLNRLRGLGYEIVEYRGYFGHETYYRRLAPLKLAHQAKTELLLRKPQPALCSYACLLLRRPAAA